MIKPLFKMGREDTIVFVLTVFLISCFLIFEKYTWGKYALFLTSGFIYLVDSLSNKGKLVLTLDKYHKCFGSFLIICFASSIWAISSTNAIEWSRSIFNNILCMTLIYPFYSRKKDISMLLSIIMCSSYLIALYAIWFYGFDTLFASSYTQYLRLGNDFSNINTIGLFCAFGLLIQFERIITERKVKWYYVFSIPSVIVLAATQSRKAVLALALGAIIIAVLNSSDKKNFLKTIYKYILIVLAIMIVLYIISKISIFSGVTERLKQLLYIITGTGELDSGTINRQKYVELGIRIWRQHPIGGVGINCPRIINQRVFGEYVYLHNNYVELLCGVGLIGFICYYYMYYYIIKNLLLYKNKHHRYYIIGITFSLLLLIMDYGMVSYYSKLQAFYFMVLFLNVKCLYKDNSNNKAIPKGVSLYGTKYK